MTAEKLFPHLTEKDREQFSKTANILVDDTFICETCWDVRKARTARNESYYYARKYLAELKAYFAMIGWEVKADELSRSVMLKRPNQKPGKLSRYTTAFLYACRLIYDDAAREGALGDPVDCTEEKVIEKLVTLGTLANAQTTATDRKETLRYLEAHKLIQRKRPGAWSTKESNAFVILPTIIALLDSFTIQDVASQVEDILRPAENRREASTYES